MILTNGQDLAKAYVDNYAPQEHKDRMQRIINKLGEVELLTSPDSNSRYVRSVRHQTVVDWWLTDVSPEGELYYPRGDDPRVGTFPEAVRITRIDQC